MFPAKSTYTGNFSHLSFQIKGEIHYKYAQFTLKSTYKNLTTNAIEAEILIPIISDFQLYDILCKIDGKNYDIALELNMIPRKIFNDAVADGKNNYILQLLEKNEIKLFNIGLVEPNSEVSYEISYACKTEAQLVENTYKLKIPHELFQPTGEEDKELLSGRFIIKNPLPDQTETHDLEIGNYIVLDNKHSAAALQNIERNQDLEVTYYYETPKTPFVIVQEDPRTQRHAFHLSYTPDKNLTNLSGWDQKGEFVLILDRSGSMSGERIKLAREAAALFIRSLPEDSFFNIISFGSSYNKMFNNSKKYDSCSVEEATRTVLQYAANMGGTNIYDPIKFILESPRLPGYPLSVFLLTDGCVGRREEVLNMIKNKRDGARISTIGISNVSETLIDQAAKEGNGVAYRVNTENEIKPAVIGSLRQSLIPALTNIQLSDYSQFDFVNPREPFHIYAGNTVDIVGVWKAGVFPKKIYFQYYSEIVEINENVEIEIKQDEIVRNSGIIAIEGKNYVSTAAGHKEAMNYKIVDLLVFSGLVIYDKKPTGIFGIGGGLLGNAANQGSFFVNTANQNNLFGNTANQSLLLRNNANPGTLFGNANQGGLFGNPNQGVPNGNTTNAGTLLGNKKGLAGNAKSGIGNKRAKPKATRATRARPQGKNKAPQSPVAARTLRSASKKPQAAISLPTKRQRENQKKIIKQAMKIDQFMIPKNRIQKIVRDFSDNVIPNMKFNEDAYKSFQEAAEAYLIEVFTVSNEVADDNKRVTVRLEDMQEVIGKSPRAKNTLKNPQRKPDTEIPKKRGRSKNDTIESPTKKVKNLSTTSQQVFQPQASISPPAYISCSNPCIDVGYEVEKLMHLQKIDGHWSSSSDLSDIINNLVCFKIDITNMNDKITTALVIAVLDERCHDYVCLWDLVAVKARRWMGKNKQSEMKLADF